MKIEQLLGVVFLLFLIYSCSMYTYTDKQMHDNEIAYLNFKAGDTVLEFGTHPEFYIPIVAAEYENLHWYLTTQPDEKRIRKKIEEVNKLFKSSIKLTNEKVLKEKD